MVVDESLRQNGRMVTGKVVRQFGRIVAGKVVRQNGRIRLNASIGGDGLKIRLNALFQE